jgi:hypothetical protein
MKKPYSTKNRKIICQKVFSVLLLLIPMLVFVLPQKDVSLAERRRLAKRPPIRLSTLLNGQYMKDFELALKDQFPGRQSWRSLKAVADRTAFGRAESNGYVLIDGTLSKLPEENESARILVGAAKAINLVAPILSGDRHRVYAALIPDKNIYLSEKHPTMFPDYDALWRDVETAHPEVKWIDLRPALSLDAFFRTDHHWRQECLGDTISKLAEAMNATTQTVSWEQTLFLQGFRGTYWGQAALPIREDQLVYCRNSIVDQAKVEHLEEGKSTRVYDIERGKGRDPYDLFLSGASAVLTISNPFATEHRTLIMFRDSFGSSLAPLLIPYYEKIILIDLRYISAANVVKYVDFTGEADVLLLLSLHVLANPTMLR